MKNSIGPKLLWAIALALFLVPRSVFAQENVQDLKKQIADLQAKVAQLEARQGPVNAMPAAGSQWDPFAEFDRMNDEMERMSSQIFQRSGMPRQQFFSNQMFMNQEQMTETKDGYQIKLDLTGYDQDKVDIKAGERTLTISGEYKAEQKKEGQNSRFQTSSFGRFLNTMPLPDDADVSQMKTEKKGNELTVFLPKRK